MRLALPGELYEIFALPGVLYENLALITGHCMEYTLAHIWCYYYADGLEIILIAQLSGIYGNVNFVLWLSPSNSVDLLP